MAGSKASSNAGRGAGTIVIAGIVAPVAVFAIPLVIVVSLMTILVALVQSQYGTTCGSDSLSSTSWVAETSKISSILHTQNPACVCEISVIFFVFRYTLGLPQAPGLAGGPDYV